MGWRKSGSGQSPGSSKKEMLAVGVLVLALALLVLRLWCSGADAPGARTTREEGTAPVEVGDDVAFPCPGCGAGLKLSDYERVGGARLRCPRCKRIWPLQGVRHRLYEQALRERDAAK
jgi:predicted RNA-binding Zn-ribbon protein involved in translation (DUF1610 family)